MATSNRQSVSRQQQDSSSLGTTVNPFEASSSIFPSTSFPTHSPLSFSLFQPSSSEHPNNSSTNGRYNHSISDSNASHDRDGRTNVRGDEEQPQKRRKIRRSKQACQHCRIRKRKCGGFPPNPCPNCLSDEMECYWPMDDGRSSASRRIKGKAKLDAGAASTAGPDTTDSVEASDYLGQEQAWSSFFGDLVSGNTGSFSFEQPITGTISPSQLDFLDLTNLDFLPSSTSFPGGTPSLNNPSQSNNALNSASPGSQLAALLPNWPLDMDPHQFVHALSSRMPTVEQSSVQEETSPKSDLGTVTSQLTDGNATRRHKASDRAQRMVKVTWWRPYGQTAIAPGLKRMTLKVRLAESPPSQTLSKSPHAENTAISGPIELLGPDRAPSIPIMRHLLGIFGEYFGSQFPCLDLPLLLIELESGRGSVFLLNSIAAISARFSTFPAIADPSLQPHEYGNVFFKVAKDMLGSMLALPSRETVVALVLLCHVGFANDSEAEEWMFAGMAVRMAIDLGLHLEPAELSDITEDERRLNRLVFGSVILLDFALAFGTGRQPTFRVEEISQSLPTAEDIHPRSAAPESAPPHPFPFAVKQMFSYGYLIELLNSRKSGASDNWGDPQHDVQKCRMSSMKAYRQLPAELQWNVTNLQKHSSSGQAPMYLQLHLWMHTIITSGYLTGTDYLRREHARWSHASAPPSGTVTPNGLAAASIWRHSARTIGDILVLCDIVCPNAYLSLPFVNQAFYVAGSCYVKELEMERRKRLTAIDQPMSSLKDNGSTIQARDVGEEGDANGTSAELYEAILKSVSTENISILRKGLTKQTKYWSGVAWVAEALEQRIQGIGASEIDLVSVTEKLSTFASVPDAGLLHRSEGRGKEIGLGGQ